MVHQNIGVQEQKMLKIMSPNKRNEEKENLNIYNPQASLKLWISFSKVKIPQIHKITTEQD